jgi:hypothetical protein
MREDSFILIQDKRRDARNQCGAFLLLRAEYVFCRGNLIKERSGSTLPFFRLHRSRFFHAVEGSGIFGDPRHHGAEFLLYRSLPRA